MVASTSHAAPIAVAPSPPPEAPSPAVPPPGASFYLAGADIARDGHGRISIVQQAGNAWHISARINQTDPAQRYRLVLRSAADGTDVASLDIDGASGLGQTTLATPPGSSLDTWLRSAATAVVTDAGGREKLRGAVGGTAIPLLEDVSIAGLLSYAARHDVRSVERMLAALPPAMRTNYTLVAESRGLQASSVDAPRIVIFGADARMLISVQTAEGAKREALEVGELLADGRWRFAEIDVARRSATSEGCGACHGERQPRPIWAAYNQWPGVFGGDADQLTPEQSATLTRLVSTQSASDRFRDLVLVADPPGGLYSIAHRSYGFTNFNATTEIVRATAEGAWTRMRNAPRYADLRLGFFLDRCDADVRQPGNAYWSRFSAAMSEAGQPAATDMPSILRALGFVDPVQDLQIGKAVIDLQRSDGLDYNQGSTKLAAFIEFLALDDWVADEPALGQRLAALADPGAGYVDGVFTGFGLGQPNLEEARRYRMRHNFGLLGEDLQRSRERPTAAGYIDNNWRIEQGVLTPARGAICDQIAGR